MNAFVVLWLIGLLGSGIVAYGKSRRVWVWMLFAVVPVIGLGTLLVVMLLPTRHAAREAERRVKAEHRRGMMECPYCLTMIPSEATVCRHCQRDVAARDLVEAGL